MQKSSILSTSYFAVLYICPQKNRYFNNKKAKNYVKIPVAAEVKTTIFGLPVT